VRDVVGEVVEDVGERHALRSLVRERIAGEQIASVERAEQAVGPGAPEPVGRDEFREDGVEIARPDVGVEFVGLRGCARVPVVSNERAIERVGEEDGPRLARSEFGVSRRPAGGEPER